MNCQNEIKRVWLLIELSPLALKMETCLEFKGYKVKNTLPEGQPVRVILEKIKDFNPDVVVLLAEHSDINPFELCRQLKAQSRLKAIPLVIFGKENSTRNAVKAFRAGAEYYVALTGEDYSGLLNLVEKLAESARV